jgi:hypothetical protein
MNVRHLAALMLTCVATGNPTLGAKADDLPPPQAGCFNYQDPAGDNAFNPLGSGTQTVPDKDDKLDITDLLLGTKGRTTFIYAKMPGGDGNSAKGLGPRWDINFGVDGVTGKDIKIIYGRPSSTVPAPAGYSASPFIKVTVGGGPTLDNQKLAEITWDNTAKFLITKIALDELEKLVETPVPTGKKFKLLTIDAKILTTSLLNDKGSTLQGWGAVDPGFYDRAPNASSTVVDYAVGDNKCFEPPASKVSLLTGTTVQYGDVANLSAKLTNEAGDTPVAGKTLTFSIAGASASGTTGADGVARATLTHNKTAGSYPLTVTFAGDDSFKTSTLSGTLVVKQEAVKILTPFKIAKSGTTRTVTITVQDDDKKAVAGQYVNWWVNGRKATAKKTATNGTVTFTAAAGQTVYAEFPAVAGKYLGTKSAATKLA